MRRTEYFPINLKKIIMITLAMLHLKMVVVKEDLVVLVVLMGQIFQIFLRIFLEILEVLDVVQGEEVQVIEDPI